jgi:hypothetical protein
LSTLPWAWVADRRIGRQLPSFGLRERRKFMIRAWFATLPRFFRRSSYM